MIEIQSLRINSKSVELLEKQISSLYDEKFDVNRELVNLNAKYEKLQKDHHEQFEMLTQIPILKEEILYLQQKNEFSSQRSSCAIENSLFAEGYEVKFEELTAENRRLKLMIEEKEKTSSILQQMQSIGSNNDILLLKYSRLECEHLEMKLEYGQNLKNLNEIKEKLEKDLLLTKQALDSMSLDHEEAVSKLLKVEKTNEENSKSLENLRQENFKLRDTNSKLQASAEVEK